MAGSNPSPDEGSEETFTLTASIGATSQGSIDDLVVTYALPTGLDYDSSAIVCYPPADNPGGGNPTTITESSASGVPTVTWTIPILNSDNRTAEAEVVVTVATCAETSNQASYAAGELSGSSNVVTLQPTACVTLTKTVANEYPQVGSAGSDIADTFTLTVDNGTGSALNVDVNDDVPSGLTVTSVVPSSGDVENKTSDYAWDLEALPAGGSATLTIDVNVDTCADITNTATFEWQLPGAAFQQGSPSSASIYPGCMSVAKSLAESSSSTPTEGSDDTFLLTATDGGPTAYGTIDEEPSTVTDVLPTGLDFVAGSGEAPEGSTITESTDPNTGVETVTWSGFEVTNESDAVAQFSVEVETCSAVDNTVGFAYYYPQSDDTYSGTSNTIELDPFCPGLSISKTAGVGAFTGADETIDYSYNVINTGNTPLSDISVTDRLIPTADITCPSTSIAVDNDEICHASYTTTSTDVTNGEVTNTASASGEACRDDQGNVVQNPQDVCEGTSVTSSSVNVTVPLAALSLAKSANILAFTASGETIDYSYFVTNSGETTIGDVGINDSLIPSADVICPESTLGPDDSETCTASYTTTAADVSNGEVTNTATADGDACQSDSNALPRTALTAVACAVTGRTTASVSVTSNSSSVTVRFAALSLVKTADVPAFTRSGESIGYTYDVTNTGETTLDQIGVTDSLIQSDDIDCPDSTLAAGASENCTASFETTSSDVAAGEVVNTASATGEVCPQSLVAGCEGGTSITSSSASVTVPLAALTVLKSSPTKSYSEAGDVITYDFAVTNSGEVTLSAVEVTDTEADPATQANLSEVSCPDATLAAGASETCRATYTVTRADLDHGSLSDSATASGTVSASGVTVTATSPVSSLSLAALYAVVTLTKSASSLTPASNGDDTFTLTATNAGPSSAGQVVVKDVLAHGLVYDSSSTATGSVAVSGRTVIWTIPDLADKGAATLSLVVSVDTTSRVTNTATYTQVIPDGSGGTSGTSNTVTLVPSYAVLAIHESVADPAPAVGSDDSFTTVVTNEGPDAANSVIVVDQLPVGLRFVSDNPLPGRATEQVVDGVETIDWDIGTLAVGASATIDVAVQVTASSGSLVNPVNATDSTFDPTGQKKYATASAVVAAPVAVPPTHTGEPWSGWAYWLLVLLVGSGGLALFESGRRARRRTISG